MWRQIQGTMYKPTQAQLDAEKKLNKQGFKFYRWMVDMPTPEKQPSQEIAIMLMRKKTNRFSNEYREIEPDGTIN